MDVAKVTSRGQITIPIAIRKMLGIQDGDKVLFVQKDNQIIMMNASIEALHEAQAAFAGEAERAGLKSDEDIVMMIKDIRNEKKGEYGCV